MDDDALVAYFGYVTDSCITSEMVEDRLSAESEAL